jgi:hypothetical protein
MADSAPVSTSSDSCVATYVAPAPGQSAALSSALIARIGCPAQPVGFICLPRREAPGPTCPLGHTVEPVNISSAQHRRMP